MAPRRELLETTLSCWYCCRSAMLARTYPRFSQKRVSSGSRAISTSFSSLTISHSSRAGDEPASRAKSTAASVWPLRARTPSSCARRGKMWTGR